MKILSGIRSAILVHGCHGQKSVRPLEILLAMGFALLAASCGYHEGGRGALLPPDIKTIAVPIFTNQTPQFRIEQQLTAAVTQEFIERTSYRITQNPAEADAVLRGTVKQIRQGVVTFNPQTGSATTLQIEVVAGVELTDLHSKKVIFSNPDYIFREQYQVSPTASTLIEEDRPALGRLSQEFARTLVTDILENF
jgi:outer membrane lipopolysaccharide assembly protein LptE/RlpB